jgi:hypothetical protein
LACRRVLKFEKGFVVLAKFSRHLAPHTSICLRNTCNSVVHQNGFQSRVLTCGGTEAGSHLFTECDYILLQVFFPCGINRSLKVGVQGLVFMTHSLYIHYVVLNLLIRAERRCRAEDQAEMCIIHFNTHPSGEVKGDTYGQVNGISAFKTKHAHKTTYLCTFGEVLLLSKVEVSERNEKVKQTSGRKLCQENMLPSG